MQIAPTPILAARWQQLAPTKAAIDWSVNCGNMSAALPVFAAQVGLASLEPGVNRVRIFNTNTGVVTHTLIDMPEPNQPVASETEIPRRNGLLAWRSARDA